MKAGSHITRHFLSCFLIGVLNLGLSAQSPVVDDIPDQDILEGQSFTAILLDELVADPDHADADLVWTYTNNVNLSVSIEDHVATISTPDENWNGTETLTFVVTDPDLNSASDDATFNVDAVNDPPVVGDIPDVSVDEGGSFDPVSLDDFVSDIDNTPDALNWFVSGNTNLDVSIDGSHVATITPLAGWTGMETLTFTAEDPGLASDDDQALYSVKDINAPPTDIELVPTTITENLPTGTAVGTFTTQDPDAEAVFTYTLVSGAGDDDNGSFTISDDKLVSDEVFDFESKSSYSIRVRSADASNEWFEEQFTITITNVNEDPVVGNIPNQTVAEGNTFTTIVLDNYVADPDHADNQMNWTYTGNTQLTVSIDANRVATITVPNADWFGSETITFTATDPLGLNDSDPATFTVTSVNDAPVVTDIPNQTIAEGASFATITLDNYVSDVDHADNQMTWTYSGNTQLTVSISSGRVATITPPSPIWHGSETITFTATDPAAGSDNDQATFTVSTVNDPPVVGDIPNQTIPEGNSFTTIALDDFVADPDHTDSQINWTYSGNNNLTVSINASRVATVTAPNADWFGGETITFTATDPEGGNDSDQATFSITSVNDAPVVTDIPNQTIAEGASFATIVLDNFVSDVDHADNQMAWTYSGNTQLTVNISPGRVATITAPNAEWSGTETITFTATDPAAGFDSDPATFTISGVNDPPVVSDIPNQTIAEGTTFTAIALDNYVADPDHTDEQINWTYSGNVQLTVSISASRVATITAPNADWSGAETITFRATDPLGANASDQAVFTITGTNDPPVATNVIITPADQRIGVLNTGSFTFTDPDGDNPGTHLYKWYRATNAGGSDAVPITGAVGVAYRPVKADGARYICFEVTPVDQYGLAGIPVKSAFKYINNSPVASNVNIYAPSTVSGQNISGRFTYFDTEGNLRGNAQYRWYRSNIVNPLPSNPGTLIGTDSTYRLRSQDAGRYIWFRVNPVALSGSTPGDSVWSNVIGPIGEFSANISGTAAYCAGATMPITLSITGGVAPYSAVLTRSGSALNKDTTIANISVSPYIINVKIPGTYVLKSLTDKDADEATVSAVSVILTINPKITAVLSGTAEICNDGTTTAPLALNFNAGTAPWTFVASRLRSNGTLISDTTYTNVTTDPFVIRGRVFSPNNSTLYRIKSLTDVNNCPGDTTGSGTAVVSYKPSPTAIISGIDSICPGETATLQVLLTGTGPWSITYLRDGANPTIVNGIINFNYLLQVNQPGTYTLSRVVDAVCSGKPSGQGIVRSHSFPTALISGSATICEYTSANLSVALTGSAPWKFSYRRNAEDPVEIPNVESSPQAVPVHLAGTYTLFEVYDKHCKGTVSGSATINVTPAPDVVISGLAAAYNKQTTEWFPITGSPSGGTFSGPGVIPYNENWYFVPSLPPVGTHNIVYTYRASPASCYGYDTAVVRVLEANAVIEFENNRTKYCLNDHAFLVTGVNLANDIGSFTISGGTGLVDHNDNTATVYPAQLEEDEYTITYTYFDGTTLSVNSKFDVGKAPVADFRWETECFQAGQSIKFTNTSIPNFGNLTGYDWKIYTPTGYDSYTTRDITHTFTEAGNYSIDLMVQTSYGCTDTTKDIVFALRPTHVLKAGELHFENFDNNPLSWRSGSATAVNSWKLDNPTKGFTTGAYSAPKCWYTYIPGTSAPKEQSWITSPCFDFSGIERPMLTMRIWRLFNLDRDGATLQYSTDSSKSWNALGGLNDGLFWFNDYQIDGKPGDQALGWSNYNGAGNDAGWVDARHSLDVLKNRKSVQFRIAYGSDGTARNNNGFAFDDFWIGERKRTALLEHFTNSSDSESATANAQLNALANDNELNIIDLQYHTSFPGDDPFYQHNPSVPDARVFYYGLSNVPYTILDGGSKPEHRIDYDIRQLDPNKVLVESLYPAKFWINLDASINGNILNMEAQVTALEAVPFTQLTIHMAVLEMLITEETGTNGETSFENVVKAMLPDAAGTTIYESWNANEPRTFNGTWEMQHYYSTEQLRVVAFVQNESTGEVYQAAIDTIDTALGTDDPLPGIGPERAFMVYPNPAQKTVYIKFLQEIREEFTLELYNNVGSLVFAENIPAGTEVTDIAADLYPDGLYIVRLVSRGQLIGTGKLMISK